MDTISQRSGGNTENHRRCNGARPKAAREESKKSDLKKFRTRERFDEIFRVAVVGDTRIGKSRLVRSLLDEEEYADDQDTFIVDFFRKKINFDNLRIKLEIWDLSGKSKHRQLGSMFYPRDNIDCLLLCYNPADLSSLLHCLEYNDLSAWQQSDNYSTDVYRCLVGLNYGLQPETERVEEDEVQRLARSLNCSYLEISRDETVILRDTILQALVDKKSPPKDEKSSLDSETIVVGREEQEQDNSLKNISLRKFKRFISINKA